MSQQPFILASGGGLDLITPPLVIKPGRLIAGRNYECAPRGYKRCDGYERFDGRVKPSEADYWVLAFDTGTAAIVTGNTVTGLTSAATGIVLTNALLDSGTYGGGNGVGRLILSEVTGTFLATEQVQVGGVTKVHATANAIFHGATNDTDEGAWEALAIERRRALIATLPGEGPVRGINLYKGSVFALRNNIGSTAAILYKQGAAGWVAQSLGREIAFTSGGVYVIAEGDVITGATSAATATIGRILLTSGSWAAGTAAGRLIINGTTQAGAFVGENLNVGANLNVATVAGDSTAHVLLPSGRFGFQNHNFFGAAKTVRMYAADGVNNAWEWDGTTFVPLLTGIADDTPDYIAAHQQHLMFGFKEGSLQTSDIGTPYSVTALGGAVEIATGYELTGLLTDVAGLLAVFCKDAVQALYGTDAATWDLKSLAEDAGAFAWTGQMVGGPIYMDDQGVRNMTTTQAFGNFVFGTYTAAIQPLFETKKKALVTPVASIRSRAKAQYRLFFSDSTGISIYLGKQQPTVVGPIIAPECLTFDLGRVVSVCGSGQFADGTEALFFGSDNGMVYQLDKGTSYDGAAVDAYIRYPFVACGSPQWEKRFHKATIEVDAPANAALQLAADFSYGSTEEIPVGTEDFTVSGGGGFWSEAFWSEFFWDSSISGLAEAYYDGIGATISVVVTSNVIYEPPHTISGMRLHYSKRRLLR